MMSAKGGGVASRRSRLASHAQAASKQLVWHSRHCVARSETRRAFGALKKRRGTLKCHSVAKPEPSNGAKPADLSADGANPQESGLFK